MSGTVCGHQRWQSMPLQSMRQTTPHWAPVGLKPNAGRAQLPKLTWFALMHGRSLSQSESSPWQKRTLSLVVIVHMLVVATVFRADEPPVVLPRPLPMTVTLLARPAPQAPTPALVPIIKPAPVARIAPPKSLTTPNPVTPPTPVVERAQSQVPAAAEQLTSPSPASVSVENSATAKGVKADSVPPAPVDEKEEPPRFGVAYLNNPRPDYPRLSKRAGEEGRVLMRVLVSEEGRADSVEVVASSGYARLDNAALGAVKQWRFIPAQKGGKPISAYVHVPLAFSLSNDE